MFGVLACVWVFAGARRAARRACDEQKLDASNVMLATAFALAVASGGLGAIGAWSSATVVGVFGPVVVFTDFGWTRIPVSVRVTGWLVTLALAAAWVLPTRGTLPLVVAGVGGVAFTRLLLEVFHARGWVGGGDPGWVSLVVTAALLDASTLVDGFAVAVSAGDWLLTASAALRASMEVLVVGWVAFGTIPAFVAARRRGVRLRRQEHPLGPWVTAGVPTWFALTLVTPLW